jgi:hypothetical protein
MSYEEEDTSIKHTRGVEPSFLGRNLQDQIEQICEVLLYFCSSNLVFIFFQSRICIHTYNISQAKTSRIRLKKSAKFSGTLLRRTSGALLRYKKMKKFKNRKKTETLEDLPCVTWFGAVYINALNPKP